MAHNPCGPTWPPCFIGSGRGKPKNRNIDERYSSSKTRTVSLVNSSLLCCAPVFILQTIISVAKFYISRMISVLFQMGKYTV